MIVDDFFERIQAHARQCPEVLRTHVGLAVEAVIERDLPRARYVHLLSELQERCAAWRATVGITSPVWVESPNASFSSLLSHIAPLRRDFRHTLVSDLVDTDVIRSRREERTRDDHYVPFRFASTSERERVSLMRDLHHQLATILPAVEKYVFNARTVERQVLHSLRESSAFAHWDAYRVSIGHVQIDDADDWVIDPRAAHDHIILSERTDDDKTRTMGLHHPLVEASVPQHALFTRETHESEDRGSLYARVVLNVNAYIEHRGGSGKHRERVVASFGYTVLVLNVELPNSPRYKILNPSSSPKNESVVRAVAPLNISIRTLTADQWFRYVLARATPNPALASVWYVLREVYYDDNDATFEQRVRRLDKRIPDNLSPVEVVDMLPSHQREYVRLLETERRVHVKHMARVRCQVPHEQCLPGRVVRGEVLLSAKAPPYMTRGRWVVVTPDGAQWAPIAVATFYLANLVARRTLDCVIASHVVSSVGDFHVTYVSSESLHDTFF